MVRHLGLCQAGCRNVQHPARSRPYPPAWIRELEPRPIQGVPVQREKRAQVPRGGVQLHQPPELGRRQRRRRDLQPNQLNLWDSNYQGGRRWWWRAQLAALVALMFLRARRVFAGLGRSLESGKTLKEAPATAEARTAPRS